MNAANSSTSPDITKGSELSTFASVVGIILGVSYPLLAISALARAGYQLLLKEGVTNYLGPALTMIAAILYLVATIGFLYRRTWTWRLSVGSLSVETLLTLVVGTLSLIIPDTIGRTVWANFGMDYAFFPFIQPILGLIWLTRPVVMASYGVRKGWGTGDSSATVAS
jgi:hypothetical protein